LYRLKDWCEKHPEAQPIAISYYGVLNPSTLGIRDRGLPMCCLRADMAEVDSHVSRAPFYWAVSSNILNGLTGPMMLEDGSAISATIRSPILQPSSALARVGSTIYIFRIDPKMEEFIHGCVYEPDRVGMGTTP
jgi:hypothetical protein